MLRLLQVWLSYSSITIIFFPVTMVLCVSTNILIRGWNVLIAFVYNFFRSFNHRVLVKLCVLFCILVSSLIASASLYLCSLWNLLLDCWSALK
jgi:hypothetical protein